MPTVSVVEKSTNLYRLTFKDELAVAIGLSRMNVLLCWIHLVDDESQTHRSSDDLLTVDEFDLAEDGSAEWSILPFETELFDLSTERASTENQRIVLRFAWDAERSGTLTDCFETEEDSDIITVTHASHGFIANQVVFFHPSEQAGGLDLGAAYIVREILDADTYTIQSKHAATADAAAAGGTVRWWYACSSDAYEFTQRVKAVDPA